VQYLRDSLRQDDGDSRRIDAPGALVRVLRFRLLSGLAVVAALLAFAGVSAAPVAATTPLPTGFAVIGGRVAPTAAGAYVSLTPFRQLDTRYGTGGVGGAVAAWSTVRVQVTGRGGIPVTGVSAVAVNVTVTSPGTEGNITVHAGGTAQPGTSNLNFRAGQTVPNLVNSPVGADGTIALTNNSGSTVQLIADTAGYYLAGTPTVPGAFASLTPFRQLDTRYGTAVAPWSTVRVQVTGRGGIPAAGVSAVAVNVTVTSPGTEGNITLHAGDTGQPGTSNLNFTAGQTVPNLVNSPVGADGTIALTNNSGSTVHLLADTAGYYLSGTPTVPGAFASLTPFRQLDTRYLDTRQLDTRYGTGAAGTVAPWATIRVQVAGRGGIPAAGVSAVAVNVTVTSPGTEGNITVHAGGTAQPGTSNLNFTAGQTIPNLVNSPVGADGTIALTNNSNSTIHLIADTAGYYLAGAPTDSVYTWGTNEYGQLGNGTTTSSTVPTRVSGLSGVVAVSGNTNTRLALLKDTTVRAWGYNQEGQLGDGTQQNRGAPVRVTGLTDVKDITSGAATAYALQNDGTVRSWGHNNHGQLGNGTTTDSSVPVRVSGLTGVTAISAGNFTALALLNDGTVRAWGANDFGQLGNGTTSHSSVPVQVKGLSGVKAISTDGFFSFALLNDGTVRAWGSNSSGIFGNGTTADSSVPVQVGGLSGVKSISSGGHTCALLNDGTVRAWGYNRAGQLGNGTTSDSFVPVQVIGLREVAGVWCGGSTSIALQEDGSVRSWGSNYSGELGNGTTTASTVPVRVSGLTGVTALSALRGSVYALLADGTVRAWGSNWLGQLGNGTTTNSSVPVPVTGLTDITALQK